MDDLLQVNVRSFSYKREIPKDASGNGGGFVFDCRGIMNPGRIESYKNLTGRDQEVIDYLEEKTEIRDFLDGVFQIVDLTLENYIARGFSNLEINFGCTGGQHRSVYSADETAKHIAEKFPEIQVNIQHVEREIKGWNPA
ncbi:MAG: RNase adapter RapZ [Weeksellaceae bacterium]